MLRILKGPRRSAHSQRPDVTILPHAVGCSQMSAVLGGLPVINNRKKHNTKIAASQICAKPSTQSTGENQGGHLVPRSQTRRIEHGLAAPGYRPEREASQPRKTPGRRCVGSPVSRVPSTCLVRQLEYPSHGIKPMLGNAQKHPLFGTPWGMVFGQVS